jgi:hypothetical protein
MIRNSGRILIAVSEVWPPVASRVAREPEPQERPVPLRALW